MTSCEIRFGSLVPAVFVRRDNRFRVQVRMTKRPEPAHLPNSGRLGELLVPGRQVWLKPADPLCRPHRRTAYDLALVEFMGRLVSVDARLPTALVNAALRCDRLPPFTDYDGVRREVHRGESRLDFMLEATPGEPPCWIEVKSVTLVEDGTARFPDAPTLRGQRHVGELTSAVAQGDRAGVIFVIQRDDARCFTPYDEADPAFGQILRQAAQAGVEVYAWRCQVSREAIRLLDTVPVML